jgi:hypothetical protein
MGFDTNKWFKQKYFQRQGLSLNQKKIVKALNQAEAIQIIQDTKNLLKQ